MGSYLRVLAVLGLENDLNSLAADDKVGRKLQDLALEPRAAARARRQRVTLSEPASLPLPEAGNPP